MVVARVNQLCSVSKQPTDGKAKASHLWAVLVKYGSIAQFTDLVLDQPPGRARPVGPCRGYGPCFAVDLCSGSSVLTHEHSRHPDAHALQRTHLRGSVSHPQRPRNRSPAGFCTGRDAAGCRWAKRPSAR